MKPALEHLPKEKEESFVVKYFDYNIVYNPYRSFFLSVSRVY